MTDRNIKEETIPVVAALAFPPRLENWDRGTLERLSDVKSVAGKLKGITQVIIPMGLDSSTPPLKTLAEFGCTEVLVLRGQGLEHRDPHQLAALTAESLTKNHRLLLCPGDPQGEATASVLAERLQTTWVADALTISVTRRGALQVNAVLPGGKLARDYKAEENCLIVSMKDGVGEVRKVEEPRQLEVQEKSDVQTIAPDTCLEKFLPADPRKVDIRFAPKIVAAGRGAGGSEGVELLSSLADDLRASLGASRVAVDLGWIPYERQVGQTGRTVRPGLYVAAGISGASHHLLGMRDSDHIIAINPDQEAPIHEVSHLSLHGDLHQIVPEIQKLLRGEPLD